MYASLAKPKSKLTKNQVSEFLERQHIKNELVKQKIENLQFLKKRNKN